MFRSLSAALVLTLSSIASVQAQSPPQLPPIQGPGTIQPLFRADLVITEAAKLPGGGVRVFIKNQGTLNAGPCLMSIKLYGANGAQIGQSSVGVPAIARGVTVTLNSPIGFVPPGGRIELKVDATNVVVESNENNNTRVINVNNLPF